MLDVGTEVAVGYPPRDGNRFTQRPGNRGSDQPGKKDAKQHTRDTDANQEIATGYRRGRGHRRLSLNFARVVLDKVPDRDHVRIHSRQHQRIEERERLLGLPGFLLFEHALAQIEIILSLGADVLEQRLGLGTVQQSFNLFLQFRYPLGGGLDLRRQHSPEIRIVAVGQHDRAYRVRFGLRKPRPHEALNAQVDRSHVCRDVVECGQPPGTHTRHQHQKHDQRTERSCEAQPDADTTKEPVSDRLLHALLLD